MAKKINGVNYTDYDDMLEILEMPNEEMAEINFRVQIISAMVEAREQAKITQKELEKMTNIHQPTIAKIENGKVDPQINTVLKLLAPLGKTLAVVPMEEVLKT